MFDKVSFDEALLASYPEPQTLTDLYASGGPRTRARIDQIRAIRPKRVP